MRDMSTILSTHLRQCPEFVAGDRTRLRELLHPAKASLALGYSVAHGFLDPGEQSLWHRLKSSEVYYFIAGRGVMKVEEESLAVEAGSVIYVPPGAKQSLLNNGTDPIEFLCLVDPAWTAADEAVVE
jgi:mannose-6-phosphate isomerase-like protein (cupin superfamily)